jgi:3-oxoacyl-[acyl-carrier protein] reductase
MMNVKGKTIVVTGGGRGLGRAMALAFAAKGANLAIVGRNKEVVDESVVECKGMGVKAKAYIANVSEELAVIDFIDRIVDDFKSLDGLINNAGITRDGLLVKAKKGKILQKMPLEDWQAVIDVDLTGVFLCTREAAANMIALGSGGVILNISSLGRAGNFGQTSYSAAKAGVAAMTVTWAKELARHQIRVAAIAPGFCETRLVTEMKPEALDRVRAGIPLRRLGRPEEIAHSALYIFENDYFTGRVLEVDGGLRF